MNIDNTVEITKKYDDIILEAQAGTTLGPSRGNRRRPVASVIVNIKERDVDGFVHKTPSAKAFILETLLPKKLRSMVGVSEHAIRQISRNKAAVIKKTVSGFESVAVTVGSDPETGHLSRGIKKIKKAFNLDTKDAIPQHELDALHKKGDVGALLLKQMRVESAKSFINQNISDRYENDKRNKSMRTSIEYLKNIDVNIAAMAKYQSTITSRYQELSLKVKYETLYVLKEVLATTLSFHRVSRQQYSAMVFNSSLPDSRKSTLIDLALANARAKMVAKFQGSTNILRRLTSGKGGNILNPDSGIDPVVAGLQNANLPGIDNVKIQTTATGGFMENIKQAIRDQSDSLLYGGGRLSALGNLINSASSAAGRKLDVAKGMTGTTGIAARVAINALELAEESSRSVGKANYGDEEQAIFDGRTYTTVNTVIPTYLSKILQSSEGIRTGREAELLTYVRSSDTFQVREDVDRGINEASRTAIDNIDVDSNVDIMMRLIQKRSTLSGDAEEAMRALVKQNIIDNYGKSNPFESVVDLADLLAADNFKKAVPRKERKEVRKILKDSKNMLSSRELSIMHRGLMQGNDATLQLKNTISSLVEFYGTAPLVEQGIIEVSDDGYYLKKEYVKKILEDNISDDTEKAKFKYDAEPTDNPENKDLNMAKVRAVGDEAVTNAKDVISATGAVARVVNNSGKEIFSSMLDGKDALVESMEEFKADITDLPRKEHFIRVEDPTHKREAKERPTAASVKSDTESTGYNTVEDIRNHTESDFDAMRTSSKTLKDIKMVVGLINDKIPETKMRDRQEDPLLADITIELYKELVMEIGELQRAEDERLSKRMEKREAKKKAKETSAERITERQAKATSDANEEFDTDADDHEEGSFKDVMATRAKRKADSLRGKLGEKNEELRANAKKSVGGLISKLLGPAAPLIGGVLSIAGGLLSFAGSTLSFMGNVGGMGAKLLSIMGVGKLASSIVGKLGFIKAMPFGSKLLGVMGGMSGLAGGSDLITGGLIAASVAKAISERDVSADGGGGGGGKKGKKKGKKAKKKALKAKEAKAAAQALKSMPKSKVGLAAAALATLGVALGFGGDALASGVPEDSIAVTDQVKKDMVQASKTGKPAEGNITPPTDKGSESFEGDAVSFGGKVIDSAIDIYEKDVVAATRIALIPVPVSVALTVLDTKDVAVVVKTRKFLGDFIVKYCGPTTNILKDKILAVITGKTTAAMTLLKDLSALKKPLFLNVLKDFIYALGYFIKGTGITGLGKSLIVGVFRTMMSLIVKFLPILGVIDVWIYSRIIGDVINKMLEDHGIHIGIIIYDTLEELGWNKYLEGAFKLVAGTANAMVDYFQDTGVTPAVSSGIETIADVGNSIWEGVFGDDEEKAKPKNTRRRSNVTQSRGTSHARPTTKQPVGPPRPTANQQRVAKYEVERKDKKPTGVTHYGPPRQEGTKVDPVVFHADERSDDGGIKPLVPDAPLTRGFTKARTYTKFTGKYVYLPINNTEEFLSLPGDVTLNGLNPDLLNIIVALSKDYHKITGKKLKINSGFRSRAKQQALWDGPDPAARPGTSMHEFGVAVDIDTAKLDLMDKHGLLNKYGLYRPYRHESWHIESIATQFNVYRSKTDQRYASKRVLEGLGHGGGGPLREYKGHRGKSITNARRVWAGGRVVSIVYTDEPFATAESGDYPEESGPAPKVVSLDSVTPAGLAKAAVAGVPKEQAVASASTGGNASVGATTTGLPYGDLSGESDSPNTNGRSTVPSSDTPVTQVTEQVVRVDTDPEHKVILNKQLGKQDQTVATLNKVVSELQKLNMVASAKPKPQIPAVRPKPVLPQKGDFADGFGLA